MKGRVASLLVLLTGLSLIALGILQRQNTAVLQKAARICLECVGIG